MSGSGYANIGLSQSKGLWTFGKTENENVVYCDSKMNIEEIKSRDSFFRF